MRVVTRAIERWTVLYGLGSAAVVIPATWIDHSAARYGDRPQSVLNEQLVDTADIVIVSRAGFDGDLETRLLSWRKEILPSYAPTEEVPR